MRLAALGFVVAACTSTVPAPESAPAPVVAAPVVEPTPEPVAPPAPTPAPADEEADARAFARALEPEATAAVDIEKVVARGDERIVLFGFRGAEVWRAALRDRGTLARAEAEIEAARERCDVCDGESPHFQADACNCRIRAADDPFVAAEGVMGDPTFVWEIARLVATGGDGWRVAARTRISDMSFDADGNAEVEIDDLDRDGAIEIHVLVSVTPVTCSMTYSDIGTLGYVLRWDDLSEQFAYTSSRMVEDLTDEIGEDPIQLDPDSPIYEIAAIERVGGGFADLDLSAMRGDSDDKHHLCPYSSKADTWTCGPRLPPPPFWRAEAHDDCRAIGLASWKRCRPPQPARCRKRG
jgi:hypothetical protein